MVSSSFSLFLAPMVLLKSLPLSSLVDSGLSKEDGFPGKYLAGILHALVQAVGPVKAAEIWRSSKVSIESFVPKDSLDEFVASNVSQILNY